MAYKKFHTLLTSSIVATLIAFAPQLFAATLPALPALPAAPVPLPPPSRWAKPLPKIVLPGGKILEDTQEVKEAVLEVVGPTLPETDFPKIYEFFNHELLPRLNSVLETYLAESFKAKPPQVTFELVSSELENAAIQFTYDYQSKESKACLILTTSELKRLLEYSKRALPGSSAHLLAQHTANILAGLAIHEFGHIPDYYDPNSIHKLTQVPGRGAATTSGTQNVTTGQQAIEIRADLEGLEMGRKARIPTDASYNTITSIIQDDPHLAEISLRSKSAAAFLASHPDAEGRRSTLRIFMAYNSQNRGNPKETPFNFSDDQALIKEIERLPTETVFRPIRTRSIDETIAELYKLRQNGRSTRAIKLLSEKENVQWTYLLSHLDEQLEAEGKGVSMETARKVAGLLFRFAAEGNTVWPETLPFDSPIFNSYPTFLNASATPHARALQDGRFYRGANYEKALGELLVPELGSAIAQENLRSLPTGEREATPLKQLEVSINSGRFAELYHDHLIELSNQMRFSSHQSGREFRRFVGGSYAYETWQVDQVFRNSVWPYLSPDQQSYVRERSNRGIGLWINRTLENKGIPDSLERILSNPESDEYKFYRGVAEDLWNNRGLFGSMARDVDWNFVFKLLKLKPELGRAELRKSVLGFLRSSGYPKLLKSYVSFSGDFTQWNHLLEREPDPEIYYALRGDDNPAVKDDPILRELALRYFASPVLRNTPRWASSVYLPELKRFLASRETQSSKDLLVDIEHFQDDFLTKYVGPESSDHAANERRLKVNSEVYQDLAVEIDRSSLTADNKRSLLDELFIKPFERREELKRIHPGSATPPAFPIQGGNWSWPFIPAAGKITQALKHNGVVSSSLEVLNHVVNINDLGAPPFKALDALLPDLKTEISTITQRSGLGLEKFHLLMPYLDDLMASHFWQKLDVAQRSYIGMHDALAEAFGSIAEDPLIPRSDFLGLVLKMTARRQSNLTDRLLKKWLAGAVFEKVAPAEEQSILYTLLNNKDSIWNSDLRTQLSNRLMAFQLPGLSDAYDRKEPSARGKITEFLKEYRRLNDSASEDKDHFLENSVLIRLKPREESLIDEVSAMKSTHWRNIGQVAIRKASLGTSILSQLNKEEKISLMHWIFHSSDETPTPELEAALLRLTLVDYGNDLRTLPQEIADDRRKKSISVLRYCLISFKTQSRPGFRLPIYEAILGNGRLPLSESRDIQIEISRNYLGYAPDSFNERAMLAWLKSIPEAERAPTLAYLVDQRGKEMVDNARSLGGPKEAGLADLFRPHGTWGAKGAQIGAILKLFGERSMELDGFKDDRPAMPLSQVRDTLKRELPPEQYSRITRYRSILGGASVKAVYEVELDGDPSKVGVLLVQRPNIADQVDTLLERYKLFFENLKAEGVTFPHETYLRLLADMEAQIKDELSTQREVNLIGRFSQMYDQLNLQMSDTMNGWRFSVPKPYPGFAVTKSVIILEKAEGVSFKSLTASKDPVDIAVRKETGRAISMATGRGFVRHRTINADGHNGNYLIDGQTKTIHVIDFGQGETFDSTQEGRDEVYLILQLLRSIKRQDPYATLRYSIRLNRFEPLSSQQEAKLLKNLSELLQRLKKIGLQDTFFGIVNAFNEQGLPFDKKYSFGVMKGLMITRSDSFAEPEFFDSVIEDEAQRLFLAKKKIFAKDGLQSLKYLPHCIFDQLRFKFFGNNPSTD